MIYQGGNMELSPIWEAFRGPVNDVLVCRDLRSPVDMRYTLLVIHDRACVKQMLTVLEQSERERGRAPRPPPRGEAHPAAARRTKQNPPRKGRRT